MTNPFQNHQKELDRLAKESGVTYLALFGSRARGDYRSDSDYDILFDYVHAPGIYELDHLQIGLQKLLEKPIDLVSKRGVSRHLRKFIKPDLQVIYEK